MVTPTLIALGAFLLAVCAERLHARRVRRIARLAFGPDAKPAPWTRIAPLARCVGLALACWGALILLNYDPVEVDVPPSPRAARQLLVVVDVSPSMNLADAGPETTKVSRGRWAGQLLQGILDRLDMKDTRISMVAFYSKALPVLQDTTDRNIVANMLDGLPLYVAFRPGKTDMAAGLAAAFDMAKGWARHSTTLVVLSDGDLEQAPAPPPRPASIADVIVIGVGDPDKATLIAGHSSRQDQWILRDVAARLGGYYHQGNTQHLPTRIVERLRMIAPRVSDVLTLREAALGALALGALLIALIGPALALAGIPRRMTLARRTRRPQGAIA